MSSFFSSSFTLCLAVAGLCLNSCGSEEPQDVPAQKTGRFLRSDEIQPFTDEEMSKLNQVCDAMQVKQRTASSRFGTVFQFSYTEERVSGIEACKEKVVENVPIRLQLQSSSNDRPRFVMGTLNGASTYGIREYYDAQSELVQDICALVVNNPTKTRFLEKGPSKIIVAIVNSSGKNDCVNQRTSSCVQITTTAKVQQREKIVSNRIIKVEHDPNRPEYLGLVRFHEVSVPALASTEQCPAGSVDILKRQVFSGFVP